MSVYSAGSGSGGGATASIYSTPRGGLPGYGGGGGVIGTTRAAAAGAVFPSWSGQAYGLPGAGASLGGASQSGARWVLRCLRKGASPSALDWESIVHQVVCAVRNPSAAYKMTQLRKQAKNLWARDDPGVVMVALALSAACAVAWGVAFGYWSPIDHLALILHAWMQLGLAVGVVMGLTRFRREALTRPRASLPHMVAPALEWAYVAEVAVNAYFPLLLCAHVGLLLTAPISLAPGWAGTLVRPMQGAPQAYGIVAQDASPPPPLPPLSPDTPATADSSHTSETWFVTMTATPRACATRFSVAARPKRRRDRITKSCRGCG